MDTTVLLATNDGLIAYSRREHSWREDTRTLAGNCITSVIAREGVILAGTTDGVMRSADAGQTWQAANAGLTIRYIRWLAYHPDISDREFAGTEPAGIFVSRDGAESWRGSPEVQMLRDCHQWFLPYSPEAGCIRGFAFHGERIYAAVEVGGVLRSDDVGETWRLAEGSTGQAIFDIPPAPLVHADVHSIESHPNSPDLVFAVTAEGLYRSADGGKTWVVRHRGSYCRAVWVDFADPAHLILGPADSVAHKNGRIEESHDGGRSWTIASHGLDLPWPDRMVERFTQVDDLLFAVTSDGRVYGAPLATLEWEHMFSDAGYVNALTIMGG
jgi:photosystem II stability/assembly factor-like uncharacterized protein